MKPNIFHYATKELSQDAFIAWLLDWANPQYRVHDEALHLGAVDFLQTLLGAGGAELLPLTVQSVGVEMQWQKIDVTAEVVAAEGKFLLVIEDKVDSTHHSNELRRYRQLAANWCEQHGYQLKCVYLKTGNEPIDTLKKAQACGFEVITRKHISALLNRHPNVSNHIWQDYRERLAHIEQAFKAFEHKPIGQNWHGQDWVGLFTLLDESNMIIHWHYVANPAGGFQNALLNWHGWQGVCVYAQLEEGKLCYKISFSPDDAEVELNELDLDEVQDTWQRILLHHAKSAEQPSVRAIRRPDRYGHRGTWRTVAVVDRQHWLGRDGDSLDIQQVIQNLTAHKNFIVECLKHENTKLAQQMA